MNDEPDLVAIAAAVRACPGVSTLADRRWRAGGDDAGSGRPGISVDEHTVEIAVIAFSGRRLATMVGQIEIAVRPMIGHRRLDVTIEDLDTRPPST